MYNYWETSSSAYLHVAINNFFLDHESLCVNSASHVRLRCVTHVPTCTTLLVPSFTSKLSIDKLITLYI